MYWKKRSNGPPETPCGVTGLNGSWINPTRGERASIAPTQVVPERCAPVTRIGRFTDAYEGAR